MRTRPKIAFVLYDGIQVSTLEENQKSTGNFTKCLLPISLGKEGPDTHSKEKANLALNLVAAHFTECEIIITDTLQRHLYYGKNFEDIKENIKRVRDKWVSAVFNLHYSSLPASFKNFKNEMSFYVDRCLFKITFWDNYINDNSYQSKLSIVNNLYLNDLNFRATIKNTIKKHFAKKNVSKEQAKEIELASIQYVLEECAVFLLWDIKSDQAYQYLLYFQGDVNEAIMYLCNKGKRYQVPKVHYNEVEFFAKTASEEEFRDTFNRINTICSSSQQSQLYLATQIYQLRKLSNWQQRDPLLFFHSSLSSGKYYFSQLQLKKGVRFLFPLLFLLADNYKTALISCQHYLESHSNIKLDKLICHSELIEKYRPVLNIYSSLLMHYCVLYFSDVKKSKAEQNDFVEMTSWLTKVLLRVCTGTHRQLLINNIKENLAAHFLMKKNPLTAGTLYKQLLISNYADNFDRKMEIFIGFATLSRARANRMKNLDAKNKEYKKLEEQLLKTETIFLKAENQERKNLVNKVSRNPRKADVIMQHGLMFIDQEDFSNAATQFQKITDIYDNDKIGLCLQDLAILAKASYLLARCLLKSENNYRLAIKYCQQASEINKNIYVNDHRYHSKIKSLEVEIKKCIHKLRYYSSHDECKSSSSVIKPEVVHNSRLITPSLGAFFNSGGAYVAPQTEITAQAHKRRNSI
ncbi:MAG: hypothetical protein P4M12_07280 [Gammaproteobacteria bacterium]|nr:hypothetical protein [Gammaproteobacteria bacterium]